MFIFDINGINTQDTYSIFRIYGEMPSWILLI